MSPVPQESLKGSSNEKASFETMQCLRTVRHKIGITIIIIIII